MDLSQTIQDLRLEKEKLERVIAALEDLQRNSVSHAFQPLSGKRRGRKSMNAKERQEVSARMKRYWASWRKRQKERREPAAV